MSRTRIGSSGEQTDVANLAALERPYQRGHSSTCKGGTLVPT